MSTISANLARGFSNGNSATYLLTDWNTVTYPALVIQKRKVPTGKQIVSEMSMDVIFGTHNVAGELLPQKAAITVVSRMPITGTMSDLTQALTIFRDIVASDEFTAAVTDMSPLLP